MSSFILIFIHVVLSLMVANMGKKRKFGFWGYLLVSLFMTPLVGLLVVFASDAPRVAKEEKQTDKI